MHPIERTVYANDLAFAAYEWPGDAGVAAPPVIFFHATSFHSRCWDQVIARLPGRHCFAVDARGHGRTAKPPLPYHWRQFGADAAAVSQALGLRGAIAVGHSMGGHAIARAAALAPDLFAALVLVDPVIFSPDAYQFTVPTPARHFTEARRNHWRSPHEMFVRFQDRPPFNTWRVEVLRDYCEYGLLPAPHGHGYVLACPPEIEAYVYKSSRLVENRDIYDAIAQVNVPVRVLRCGLGLTSSVEDLAASPTAPDLASHFARGEDVLLPDLSHFIPMEAPQVVADAVTTVLGEPPPV